jgi:hypothetical protein
MNPAKAKSEKAGYETRDVAPRNVVYAGIGLLLGTALCGLLVIGLLALLPAPSRPSKPALETVSQEPPAPRLEIDGRMNRAAIEGAAASRLTGYAWVDRSAGTARIPIERAMELLARQGWGEP